jgi:hypothetical protein
VAESHPQVKAYVKNHNLGLEVPYRYGSETRRYLMKEYRFTDYFENEVLHKRPYLKKEWCIRVIENPLKTELQEHNRYRFWAAIEERDRRTGWTYTARGDPGGQDHYS